MPRGRPKRVLTEEQVPQFIAMVNNKVSVRDICKAFNFSIPVYYRFKEFYVPRPLQQ